MENLVSLDDDGANKDAIIEQIRKAQFFSDLGPDEINTLAGYSKAYSARAGDSIFTEGSEETNLCFLIEGQVSISKQVSPFESVKISDIEAGGVIGEIGIIDGEAVSATVKAAKDSIVVIISGPDFDQLVQENGLLGAKLLRKIARIITTRLRRTTSMLADVSMSRESRMLKY